MGDAINEHLRDADFIIQEEVCDFILDAAVDSLPTLEQPVADELRSRLPLLPMELRWLEQDRGHDAEGFEHQLPKQIVDRMVSWITASSPDARTVDRAIYGDSAVKLAEWIESLEGGRLGDDGETIAGSGGPS